MTAELTAILDEIDRQLLDIRAAADGLATKAGLLFAAAGVAAAILAPAAHPGRGFAVSSWQNNRMILANR